MTAFSYADPATLHGRLQRGRGLGARRAQNAPGAADLVFECVVHDSRWDPQTEQRDAYPARLIHRLDLPLAPIERQLSAGGGIAAGHGEQALQVLALLPLLGRIDAVPILRRHAGDGQQEYPAPPAFPTPPAAAPALLPGPDGSRAVSPADLSGRAGRSALEELGRRGDLAVLDLAEDVSLRNAAGWIPGMPRALHFLGSAAVARARTWAGSGDGTLEQLAVGVLSEFGDRDDGSYLLDVLTRAAGTADWCATEEPARGLGRLGVAAAAEALVHAWESTVHSAAREAILEGLRGCAPCVAHEYAVEGLDDCEPRVQQAASTAAPDTPHVRARLAELADDPLAPEVHETARLRLTRLTGT